MAPYRIANLVAHPDDRQAVISAVYEIPPHIISPGFSVGNVALARRQSMVNELDRAITELTFVEAGIRAEKEGYDAIFISPVADYGARQLRSVVRIPVIGGGQAAMQAAVGLGPRFAILSVWPEILRDAYQRHLNENGFDNLCSGIYFVTTNDELPTLVGEDGMIHELGRTRRGALLDRLEKVAREAVKDGTHVIVLGCTCMSPVRDELAARLDGPIVIDPLVVGYRFVEMTLSAGLVHRAGPPSVYADDLAALIEAINFGAPEEEVCGDSCALMSEPQLALV